MLLRNEYVSLLLFWRKYCIIPHSSKNLQHTSQKLYVKKGRTVFLEKE